MATGTVNGSCHQGLASFNGRRRQGRVRPYQRGRAGCLNGLNEGQKITYEVQPDRGKDAAVNLKVDAGPGRLPSAGPAGRKVVPFRRVDGRSAPATRLEPLEHAVVVDGGVDDRAGRRDVARPRVAIVVCGARGGACRLAPAELDSPGEEGRRVSRIAGGWEWIRRAAASSRPPSAASSISSAAPPIRRAARHHRLAVGPRPTARSRASCRGCRGRT